MKIFCYLTQVELIHFLVWELKLLSVIKISYSSGVGLFLKFVQILKDIVTDPEPDYVEHNGIYSCVRCFKCYKFKGNIRRHLKYECGKEATFACHLCDFKCKRADYLRFHLNSKKHAKVQELNKSLNIVYVD